MKIHQTLKTPIRITALAVFLCLVQSETALAANGNVPELTLSAADYSETFSKDAVAGWLKIETSLSFNPEYVSEAEDTQFCPKNTLFCEFSVSRNSRGHIQVLLASEIDEEGIRTFVDSFSEKVDQEPKDAVFSADANRNITVAKAEEMGRALKKDESVELISKVLQNASKDAQTIQLPTEVTKPKITSSDKDRLGLKEIIGEGKSNFKGSPKNRIYNINRSLQQFQNIIIAPDQEFSFVDYLGEVDG
ncbi:MAG: peptidoglycan binding domain-containing protein, partial [Patescibacteria group bacterium]